MAAMREADPVRRLSLLSAVLDDAPKPSPPHAFLSMAYAETLSEAGREDAALDLLDGLLIQYPDNPAIRMQAIYRLAYTSQAERAGRMWIELAASDPRAARELDGYTLDALTGNLQVQGKTAAIDALYLALDRIGYDPGSQERRSRMYHTLFDNAARDDGRADQARAALAKIDSPEILRSILANRFLRKYWPFLPSDEAAWRQKAIATMDAMIRDADASDEGLLTLALLTNARHFVSPRAVIDAYQPELDAVLSSNADPDTKTDYAFWVSPLAFAHWTNGEPNRAERLYRAALRFYDTSGETNRINVSANYARFLVAQGRPEEALALAEPALIELTAKDTALGALLKIHSVRLVALHALGRDAQARESRMALEQSRTTSPAVYVDAMLKIGEFEAARDALVDALNSADAQDAVEHLQRPMGAYLSPYELKGEAALDTLRGDPKVRAALRRVGRIVELEPIVVPVPPSFERRIAHAARQ